MAERQDHRHHNPVQERVREGDTREMAKDPVCGMTVDPETTQHHAELGGTPYYFCSSGCHAKFKTNPDRYLNPPQSNSAAQSPELGAIPSVAEGTI